MKITVVQKLRGKAPLRYTHYDNIQLREEIL